MQPPRLLSLHTLPHLFKFHLIYYFYSRSSRGSHTFLQGFVTSCHALTETLIRQSGQTKPHCIPKFNEFVHLLQAFTPYSCFLPLPFWLCPTSHSWRDKKRWPFCASAIYSTYEYSEVETYSLQEIKIGIIARVKYSILFIFFHSSIGMDAFLEYDTISTWLENHLLYHALFINCQFLNILLITRFH